LACLRATHRQAKAQNNIENKTYPCRVVGGEVAEDLFERGLCLPSGTAMTDDDLERVVDTILMAHAQAGKDAKG
jgi:dTDP-4-amino-4,6-dideoxygalactose transaminase